MGNSPTVEPELPPRNPVPEGKTRICVAGYEQSAHFTRARNVAHEIVTASPDQYESWYYGPSRTKYFEWLATWKATVNDEKWKDHKTSPMCWFEKSDGSVEVLGGRDRFCEWTIKTLPDSKAAKLADSFLMMEYFNQPPKATAT